MADDRTLAPAVANGLALALIASSDAPILLLDGEMKVLAASASFSRGFQIDPATIDGRPMHALGHGEWDVPQLRSLLRATIAGAKVDPYEMELTGSEAAPRRLVITAHKLEYGDADNVRVMLAISDVTDARLAARLKDDLLREKGILFQELQHRVANSLQIIASVLMQSARTVPSAEVKGYLFDAHSRVMSVAALQRQLAASHVAQVSLRSYFTELCESIGASMIHDHAKLTLKVEADEGSATAEVSVSLGLIVTELVINALKHAFPDDKGGAIIVGYKSERADWTLSVSDDGVGMASPAAPNKGGLGTSIVQALAKQLDAEVTVAPRHPGTVISVIHRAGQDEAETLAEAV